MEAAQASAPDRTDRSQISERKCIVTSEVRPKAELIRFVVSPDHQVIPDLAHNLPGRGLWVTADREHIDAAARKNLFSKAAKQSVKADADLADLVAALMRKRCLEFIGLARRAGIAVLGQPQVEAALKAGKVALLFLADDAGTNFKSLSPGNGTSMISTETPSVTCIFTRDELGAALGHDQIVYAGLKSHGLTEKLAQDLRHLEKLVVQPYMFKGQSRNQ